MLVRSLRQLVLPAVLALAVSTAGCIIIARERGNRCPYCREAAKEAKSDHCAAPATAPAAPATAPAVNP